MKCNDYLDDLLSYIDNELSEEDTSILLEHLALCEACQQTLEELKFIKTEIRSTEHIQLPEGFHKEMMEKVKREQKESSKLTSKIYVKHRWMYLGTLAAAFLFVWIGSNVGLKKSVLDIEKAKNVATQTQESVGKERELPEVSPLQHRAGPAAFSAELDVENDLKRIDEEETTWHIKVVSKEEAYEKVLKIIEENQYQLIEENENELLFIVNNREDKRILKENIEDVLNLSIDIDKATESLKIRIVLMN